MNSSGARNTEVVLLKLPEVFSHEGNGPELLFHPETVQLFEVFVFAPDGLKVSLQSSAPVLRVGNCSGGCRELLGGAVVEVRCIPSGLKSVVELLNGGGSLEPFCLA